MGWKTRPRAESFSSTVKLMFVTVVFMLLFFINMTKADQDEGHVEQNEENKGADFSDKVTIHDNKVHIINIVQFIVCLH